MGIELFFFFNKSLVCRPSSTSDAVDKHTDFEYHSAEKLGKEVNRCEILYPECNFNFMQQFSRLLS